MQVVISMLRGVNVGGHRKIKMIVLREICTALGFKNPQTYIQSGNVVFESGVTDGVRISEAIEQAIEEAVGFRPNVIVRSTGEMAAVVAANPFAKRDDLNPAKLVVLFLSGHPGQEVQDKIAGMASDPEEMVLLGRELYIYFPNGMGRSKLSLAMVERTLKMPATGRNWNTVLKLLEMAGR